MPGGLPGGMLAAGIDSHIVVNSDIVSFVFVVIVIIIIIIIIIVIIIIPIVIAIILVIYTICNRFGGGG